jgi:cholesterol transport system auxiliary component
MNAHLQLLPRAGRVAAAIAATLLALAGLAGCGSLLGPVAPPPQRFSLDGAAEGIRPAATPSAPSASAPVLFVTPPDAAPGFATDRIVYLRAAQQPEPYADHAWVAAPARMLAPLMVEALQRGGAFSAVVSTPSSAVGQVQLDTQVVRLQHELIGGPGRVRFTLRATLVDKRGAQQRVRTRDLESVVPTASDDATGAAHAAQAAVKDVLGQLAAFCAAEVGGP